MSRFIIAGGNCMLVPCKVLIPDSSRAVSQYGTVV